MLSGGIPRSRRSAVAMKPPPGFPERQSELQQSLAGGTSDPDPSVSSRAEPAMAGQRPGILESVRDPQRSLSGGTLPLNLSSLTRTDSAPALSGSSQRKPQRYIAGGAPRSRLSGLARADSAPNIAFPGFAEREPRPSLNDTTPRLNPSASAGQPACFPKRDSQQSLGTGPTGRRRQPCLASLTIRPDQENIAAIRRLIDQYEYRIQMATSLKLVERSAEDVLVRTLMQHTLLPKGGKQKVRNEIRQRKLEQGRLEREISSLADRKSRLLPLLSLINAPEHFRKRMESTLEYLCSIPDSFDPNVPYPVWHSHDHFEE